MTPGGRQCHRLSICYARLVYLVVMDLLTLFSFHLEKRFRVYFTFHSFCLHLHVWPSEREHGTPAGLNLSNFQPWVAFRMGIIFWHFFLPELEVEWAVPLAYDRLLGEHHCVFPEQWTNEQIRTLVQKILFPHLLLGLASLAKTMPAMQACSTTMSTNMTKTMTKTSMQHTTITLKMSTNMVLTMDDLRSGFRPIFLTTKK